MTMTKSKFICVNYIINYTKIISFKSVKITFLSSSI